jgi:hypothetical protein
VYSTSKVTPSKKMPDNMGGGGYGDIQQPPVYDQASYDDYPPEGVQQQMYPNMGGPQHAHAQAGRYDEWGAPQGY